MRNLIAAMMMVCMMGCATVTLNTACPASSTGVAFALAGSTVGNQLLSMLSSGLTTAGFLAKQGATTTPVTTATMTYTYIPIFGADSGSLTCTQPTPPPVVVSAGPPPAILH